MYNLIKALGETAETVEVYKTYAKDAKDMGCEECSTLWNKYIKQEEDNVREMKQLLISQVKEGKFSE